MFQLPISIYIKGYRTPLSPRRPLIGLSPDFTCEYGSGRACKWSKSDVDCNFLIKVTRENSLTLTLHCSNAAGQPANHQQQQQQQQQYRPEHCSTRSLCYDSTIWNWSCTELCCRRVALIVTGLATMAIYHLQHKRLIRSWYLACLSLLYLDLCRSVERLSVIAMSTWMAVVRWHLHRWLHVMQSSLRRIYIVHI